jgi:hypothetical protein
VQNIDFPKKVLFQKNEKELKAFLENLDTGANHG